jgi:hypothetical protein
VNSDRAFALLIKLGLPTNNNPGRCSCLKIARMWASFETFFSSFIQCSIGFPSFFSIEGKYEAGPVEQVAHLKEKFEIGHEEK